MYPGTWAKTQPDKPAVIIAETGRALTYGELDARSNQLAHWFRANGLTVGDHIAMVIDNRTEFLEVAWAAQRSGLYYTPVNWHLTPAEMAYVVRDCGARAVIFGPNHIASGDAILAEAGRLLTLGIAGASGSGMPSYEGALTTMPTDPIADEAEGFDMIYSSGTTGPPKGGVRRLLGIRPGTPSGKLTGIYQEYGIDESSVYLTPGAPLYHSAPLRWTIAVHRLGGTAVVMERFDAVEALAAMERYRITHSQWVPTMFVRMLALPPEQRRAYNLSASRVAVHSAAPCPAAVKREMLEWWGPVIYEYYGASEGGLVTQIGPEEWLEHAGSVGKARWGAAHIMDLDDDDVEVPPGTIGRIFCEGGVRVKYHNDGSKTANAHNSRGWVSVGDIGYVDDDGYLYLVDRRDDLIIAGGVNIYPKEIEDVLIAHPAVADVAVFGVPHPDYGQQVKAVVELVDQTDANPELAAVLIEHCQKNLAKYKVPRSVDFEREFPRAPSGKLYKRRLRARYVDSAADKGTQGSQP